MVRFALRAQAGRVHADGADLLQRLGVEAPAIGRDQPGDADDLAFAQGLHDLCAPGRAGLQSHAALADQEEAVGGIGLVEQIIAAAEMRVRGAAADQLEETLLEALEERMFPEDLLDVLERRGHERALPSWGFSRIAATSSVMSMPTGHQVMQRPQPTQPEEPNWSYQVASLWVIHWR